MDKFNEELTQKVATDLGMDKEIVRKIVSFQFKDILRAARTSRNMEMTWFGKWYASPGKCRRHIARLIDLEKKIEDRLNRETDMSELKISSCNAKLKSIRETIEFLRSKMDYEVRYKGVAGGNMEQSVCEGVSRDSSHAETEHLQGMFIQLGSPEKVQQL